jgi:hypothetical protein
MKGVVIHSVGYLQFLGPVINCPQWQLFTGLNPQKFDGGRGTGQPKTAQGEKICPAFLEDFRKEGSRQVANGPVCE